MKKPIKILAFIRMNDAGFCEKVTWFKNPDDTKEVKKEPFKPSAVDILLMAKSKYGEAQL